jgi:hypothetical protein
MAKLSCPHHPDVFWYDYTPESPRPCFVCSPDGWPPLPERETPEPSVVTAVQEMVQAGHWPPAEEA